jgi:hypothetical protein
MIATIATKHSFALAIDTHAAILGLAIGAAALRPTPQTHGCLEAYPSSLFVLKDIESFEDFQMIRNDYSYSIFHSKHGQHQ